MRKQALILLSAVLTSALVAIGSGTARASSPVSYDATGGARCASCHTLSWSHTVSGSNTVLLVGIGVGILGDSNCSASVTYNGAAMISLAKEHAFSSSDGFEQVFGLAAPPGGAHTVAVTVSGCSPAELTGESESFDNAAGTFSGVSVQPGDGPSPSITTSGSTSGDIYAGFIAAGHAVNGVNFGTSRLIENQDNTTGAGNTAASTIASSGSGVQLGWALSAADYWGIVAVQVNQFTGSSMPPPPGFSTKIFEDQFTGTSLDTSKWVTYLGAEGTRWNDNGFLPSPYSGPNMPGNGFHLEMYGPSQVTVNNGVTLTAQKNTGQYSSTYPWISGIITTEGKFSLPTTSAWYVQVKAKMPDVSQGMWPALWFLRGPSGSPDNEFDAYEGGWLGTHVNQIMHTDFFADQGQVQNAYDTGTDLTTAYHIYGVKFVPNTSITVYLDGKQVWQVLASQGYTIAAEPYQIMLQLQVAASAASGWHTTANSSTATSSMQIAEVQAYTP